MKFVSHLFPLLKKHRDNFTFSFTFIFTFTFRPGREADHSPPSSAEGKELVELYLHSPNTPSWCGARLKL
jgi:hypothetical protein